MCCLINRQPVGVCRRSAGVTYPCHVSADHFQDLLLHPDRHVRLESVHNFRDLGGYPADGGTTRWGMIYRADGLFRLTPEDLDVVSRLKLRTVIDLRTFNELEVNGTFPVDDHPVEFVHVPVIDQTWSRENVPGIEAATEYLVWAYRDMLDSGAEKFASAFRVMTDPANLPAVFHCAAGKDRTGLIAAMVLMSVGVHINLVVADYGLTNGAIDRLREWARDNHPALSQKLGDTPPVMLAADPTAMHIVLSEIEAKHGSMNRYLNSLGVTDAELAALRAAFVS